MSRLLDKVAVVTGGGSGIGAATCRLFANQGAKLLVTDIDLAAAQTIADQIKGQGGEAVAMHHDVSSESGWISVMSCAQQTFGKVNILVNNAGVCVQQDLISTSLQDWRKTMGVNLDGAFIGVREAIKSMLANKESGSIINIASVNGLSSGGIEGCASYCASKAGLRLLTKSAALECGRKGYPIRVNAICPGGVNTAMNQMLSKEELAAKEKCHPVGRMAEPVDIANSILFLASEESSFVTGADFIVDGGVTAGFVSGDYPEMSAGGASE